MQGKAGLETVYRLQLVAIEDRGMVVTQFHHDKHVQGIGLIHRFAPQAVGSKMDDMGFLYLRPPPLRHLRQRRIDVIHQGLDLRVR